MSTTVDTAATPTDRWLAAAPHLPPLDGPAATAERLLLLVHYGIDWHNGWVGKYRPTYWDKVLPDRVIAASWRADTLTRWWSDLAAELGSAPRSSSERAELAGLLADAAGTEVLTCLRLETTALLLRTRITAEARRDAREAVA